MITVHVKANIPESRRLVIDLPTEAPTGPADLEIRVAKTGEVVEMPEPTIDVTSLPKYFDRETGEWRRVGRSGVVREVTDAK